MAKPLRSTSYPPSRLLNPAFRYVNSFSTDIRQLFARVQQDMARQQVSVVQMTRKK